MTGFLEKLAHMNNRDQLGAQVQVGFSNSGPAFVKGGLRSNSFTMEFGWVSSSVTGAEILGGNFQAIKSMFGQDMLDSIQSNPSMLFDYARRLEAF